MRRIVIVGIVSLLIALPAGAGLHYKSRTYQEGQQTNKQMQMEVEGWVEGENAKILFTDSENTYMGTGTYLLTNDGGETLYLVDPQEKTYSEWDLDAVFRFASSVMNEMGPLFDFEIENSKVETLLEEAGGEIAGYATTHYRFKTSYDMQMKIMGIKRAQHMESVEDVWSTDAIADPAMGVWLRKRSTSRGDSALDELIATEMEKMKGFPLKRVDEVITTGKKGKQRSTKTITEVSELSEQDVDDDLFMLPEDYENVPLLPDLEAQMEDQGRVD